MNIERSLLRKECFGGTLYAADSGKRIFITHEEFETIKKSGEVPSHLIHKLATQVTFVRTIEPCYIPANNFSSPNTVYFEVTHACNLTCKHCFNNSGKKLSEELTPEKRLEVVQQLIESGVQEIRFTGGEPMAIPDIYDLMKAAAGADLKVSMGTHAGLIHSKKIALRLVESGLRLAVVSVDGLREKHDEIRGESSFEKTLKGLFHLLEAGVSVRINAVVMRCNLSLIPDLVQFFVEQGLAIYLRRFIPSGRGLNQGSQMLSASDYQQLKERLAPLMSKFPSLIHGHYIEDESQPQSRIPLPFTVSPCSAGQRGMVIWPTGEIKTCGFLGPLGEGTFGRIPDIHFAGLWKKIITSQHISSLQNNLSRYNRKTTGPQTNCLAIGLADINPE